MIGVSAGATATDAVTVCVDLQNNDFAGQAPSAGGGADFFIREGTGTNTLILPGYAGGATDNAAVTAFVQGQNTGTPTGFVSSGDGITGTACP